MQHRVLFRCWAIGTFPESLSCFGEKTDACCDANSIVNHGLEVHFDAGCPEHDGDVSVIGCVEFTGCKYESKSVYFQYHPSFAKNKWSNQVS